MIFLRKSDPFPPINLASKDGILAIGGDLSQNRLLTAYKSGIFPWYNQGEPIVWYAPPKRMVLFPDELKVSKSMRQVLKKELFKVTFNQNFKEVIYRCKTINRKDQTGTWITDEMEEAYIKLHQLNIAKSVEVWQNNKLVGGLYGIDLGSVFCGESMFSLESNASKVAFIHLVKQLKDQNYKVLDCQVYNNHLASLGAREIPRDSFMKILKNIEK
ncbi:MAG TPA: leucyl/phenylalanyl-tRNA--protein transferase [Flavobacteriia bacterium]|jgi:leucyl/phenylalanyl-tRNA--protein transferase|nr:leucyl/phenylalanyl-tRNA--protein transferase [Flavobacteriia bacterium]